MYHINIGFVSFLHDIYSILVQTGLILTTSCIQHHNITNIWIIMSPKLKNVGDYKTV